MKINNVTSRRGRYIYTGDFSIAKKYYLFGSSVKNLSFIIVASHSGDRRGGLVSFTCPECKNHISVSHDDSIDLSDPSDNEKVKFALEKAVDFHANNLTSSRSQHERPSLGIKDKLGNNVTLSKLCKIQYEDTEDKIDIDKS